MYTQNSFKDFKHNYETGKTQIHWQWIPGDLETPVSAYLKIAENEDYSFLLESVEGGATLGRYSVIGTAPDMIWKCERDEIMIWHDYGSFNKTNDDPLCSLRALIKICKIESVAENLPPMVVSGLFGQMGYDMIRLMEDIPDTNTDNFNIPDSILIRPQVLVIFDNIKNMICVCTPVYYHQQNSDVTAAMAFEETQNTLDRSIKKLSAPLPTDQILASTNLKTPLSQSSNIKKEQYLQSVEAAKDYILKGDIFQVVLGQSFSCDFDLPSVELYRALRTLNPSPFMFLLDFKEYALVGSSPEILVRVRDDIVTIRPIAGTRPRGANTQEDDANAKDLLADEKEMAEHLMLLDLGRNDVGRVSEYGSVTVTEQFKIEKYSHVMHVVSNVEGRLKQGCDIVDALFAGFPAGTVSGAPKIRAMEIIDELETNRRAYYGGAVGYLSGNGAMDTCIALRTALIKDGKIHVQAGGGLVADSNAEDEYQESVNKAKALFAAANLAVSRRK